MKTMGNFIVPQFTMGQNELPKKNMPRPRLKVFKVCRCWGERVITVGPQRDPKDGPVNSPAPKYCLE